MASTQAAMGIRSPLAKGEDDLTALPAELLVDIVEQLPVREICRLRSVNRHLRDFVDANQGLLTQDLIGYHQARIHDEYKLLADLSGCDIVDALRRYDSHYGIVRDGPNMSAVRKSEAVSPTFNFNWMASHHLQAAGTYRTSEKWKQMYSLMSCSQRAEDRTIVQKLAVDRCLEDHVWSPGFADAKAFLTKLAQVTSTRVDALYAAIPSIFITERKVDDTRKIAQLQTHQGFANRREKSELEQLLGLPDLDSTEGMLAYCSSSRKPASLVHGMAQGRSSKLKQAAIIEEIFIWQSMEQTARL